LIGLKVIRFQIDDADMNGICRKQPPSLESFGTERAPLDGVDSAPQSILFS
jgi:hypothetical protein